jgi:TRAP-type uncharacterized transport system substrate-binding protein
MHVVIPVQIEEQARRALCHMLAGEGPVQNVVDLLNFRRADAAIVPSGVLPYLRDGQMPGVGSSIAYIEKLDQEEVHILARQDITSIADLAGKKVNFDLGVRCCSMMSPDQLHRLDLG